MSRKRYAILTDDQKVDSVFRSRSFQLQLFVFAIALIIIFRLVHLQVIEHRDMRLQSDKNRLSLVPITPYRGRILDRKGRVLADNKVSYQLSLSPFLPIVKRKKVLEEISAIIDLEAQSLENTYLNNIKRLGYKSMIAFALLSDEQASAFANRSFLYPDVELDFAVVRNYPYKEHATHLLGYVGKISEQDMHDPSLFDNQKQAVGFDYVGKTGVEKFYDKTLRGISGYKIIELDSRRKKVRDLSVHKETGGEDVHLTVDVDLQIFIDEMMASFRGAIVMLDVQTGNVLAMSSAPTFDNNLLLGNQSQKLSEAIDENDTPFFNRAIHGLYPPASTIKPFVALALLYNETVVPSKKIFADSYFVVPEQERRFHDWKEGGHGWVNLYDAIAQSSDVYFYKASYSLGIDKLSSFMRHFPFGKQTGIDLPGEKKGILPSREWKRSRHAGKWLPGETVIYSIGQGYFLTTPLQLAVATAALANHGEVLAPRVSSTEVLAEERDTKTRFSLYNEADWNVVIQSMHDVVSKKRGTAYASALGSNYLYAGKTGTSQIISLAQDPEKRSLQKNNLAKRLQDHSIFIAFAPLNNPRVAVSVVIENGGSGSKLAAPIARVILDKYFELFSG